MRVVRANAKIHILKQFTTDVRNALINAPLYVLMQRYTFWSNSQHVVRIGMPIVVVRANAKIHILKQFTTRQQTIGQAHQLYVLMQRYTFWSNSQQGRFYTLPVIVVRANAKIHILKQFTTNTFSFQIGEGLYVLMQRYTFWSNSQLCPHSDSTLKRCTC
mgnify:CR=1 FL=1